MILSAAGRFAVPATPRLLRVFALAAVLVTHSTAGVGAAEPSLDSASLHAEIGFGSEIAFSFTAPWSGPAPESVQVRFGLPDGVVVNRANADFVVRDGRLTATHPWRLRGAIVPGTEVEYRFFVAMADGQRLVSPLAQIIYMDPALDWEHVREGLVDIWYYAGGADLEADARRGVRGGLALLRDDFGVELARSTRLILYADGDRMREALGGGTSPWVGGAAISGFNVTVLHAAEEPRRRADLAAVIAHELTHIAIDHATDNPFGGVPAWLHEGLATVVEASFFERFPYAEIMADAVASEEFVSLRGITGSFPASGRRAVQAYAQSNSLVQYIIERWGSSGIGQLFEAYAQGVTDDDAVNAALGVSLLTLERDWLASHGVESPTFAGLAEAGPPVAQAPSGGAQPSPSPAGPARNPDAPILAGSAEAAPAGADAQASLNAGAPLLAGAVTLVLAVLVVSGLRRSRRHHSRA